METLIVICLLVVIVLLLQDKIVIQKTEKKKITREKRVITLPDIMGLPKPVKRLWRPNSAIERQDSKQEDKTNNFDHEIEKKDLNKQIPQEELDEVFGDVPDLKEEEEEWNRYGVSDGEEGFAMGVTFEELGTVGMVLRAENPEPSLQKQAVDIVHRIQGTELFSLLENSMEGASRRIAELLDQRLSLTETDSGSSIMRSDTSNDFDIEAFI
ncbi:conjugal transfer protein TraD [Chryseobacterium sp. MEBOG07]|uniref:conjugal transfer protein TraD n=1 Tax=Chryseobacterium sp. MEBOG07 TaxID=2879939 RepID=UPI001F280E6F|nr:conjugal transfer protein TraD [Chryseobacterium sp. MEBOG07]UKB78609.1 conjugal transfer protein TraD [Chryseobacterium sp. MEBOG07]